MAVLSIDITISITQYLQKNNKKVQNLFAKTLTLKIYLDYNKIVTYS